MTDLLTKTDYEKIAGALSLLDRLLIGDAKVAARSGRTFETVNPATGAVLGRLPAGGAEDVEAAVAAARAAFDGWSKTHPAERKATLLRLAALVEANLTERAVLESLDSGKTIFDCVTVDLPETVKCLRWHAEAIDKIYDQVSPASEDHIAAQAALIRTDLPVMNDADPRVPYALLAGAEGLIWGGATFAPRTCIALVRAARAGRWAEAREIWRWLEPAMTLIWQGDYVQSVYAAAEITGYGAGRPRRPLHALDPAKSATLRAALGDLVARERDTVPA